MLAAPLAGIAGRWLAYAAGALLLAALVFGAWQWAKAKDARTEAAETRVEAAEAEVARARAELELVQRSTAIAEELVADDLVRLRELAPKVEDLRRQLRNAKTPIPAGCEPVLGPVRRAGRGLQELRADSADGRHRAAGALPDVR